MRDEDLMDIAKQARLQAHAPYSAFMVGAAIEADDGTVIRGCNVENASYGLTICAERVAIQAAVAAGHRSFRRLAVVGDTVEPISPCGACRQVIVEFCPDAEVIMGNLRGDLQKMRASKLLPGHFSPAHLQTKRIDVSSLTSTAELPLAGLKVLDLTRILAGPFATQKLADMGADVVKIERPGAGDDTRAWGPPFIDGVATYFLAVNRGKRSLALDLKSPRGREALQRLILRSDVLIENFRPGVLESLGFSWDKLQRLNPRLIYCSISGYGHHSKRREEPSFDVLIQAESGLMSLNGDADGPPFKVGISIADEMAGQLAVEGILLALLQRHKSGKGERVDISLLDGIFSLLTYQGQLALSTEKKPWRMGNRHPSISPYEVYETATEAIAVAVGNEGHWRAFCEAIGRSEWVEDARFARNRDRVAHREALAEMLKAHMKTAPAEHWMAALKRADVPAAPILDVAEALRRAEEDIRGILVSVSGESGPPLRMVGNPVFLGKGRRKPYGASPKLGQHTREVLMELGFQGEDLAAYEAEAQSE